MQTMIVCLGLIVALIVFMDSVKHLNEDGVKQKGNDRARGRARGE